MTQNESYMPNTPPSLFIDALEYPEPSRQWFEEWRAGNLACVHVTLAIWENARETLTRIGLWRRAIRENADIVRLTTTATDILKNQAEGKTSIVFGFQNTAPIEHDIELIETFRDLGVCVMQLTYNLQNYIGCGYWETEDSGLSSRFGREAVREMNRVGVLIDLSHCGVRTTRDAIDFSSRPVSITHANPNVGAEVAFGAKRLKDMATLKALAERGGVVGLSPNKHMLANGVHTTVEEFCALVARTVDAIGVDAVGIGVDYCAGHPPSVRTWWRYARWSRDVAPATTVAPHEGWQQWFRNPSDFGNIFAGLTARGFSQEDVNALMGGNWQKLFSESFKPAAPDSILGLAPAAAG